MSDPAASVSRPMKFPYTFTAKIAQFPYAFHIKNNWLYRYYCYGFLVSLPVFYKIHKLCKNEFFYTRRRKLISLNNHSYFFNYSQQSTELG